MTDESGFHSTHPISPPSIACVDRQDLYVVYPDPLAGQRIGITSELIIGRSPDSKVTSLFHSTISREHAAVQVALGGVFCLKDLGSRNGTRVNGRASELPMPLEAQSVVRLGDVLAVVDDSSQDPPIEDPVLFGTSPLMARARDLLTRAALDPAPILVVGETGTGKERVASEVHRLSGRSGPYLTLNCAELSPHLIESQLFGHERGAFTGATTPAQGLFRAAQQGTLFLDEIGELPIELQPKLLRVLQESEVRAVGGVRAERVDVRVVAATNRDLAAHVEQGAFRRDLYARLALWELRLPPLRERRQDILAWVQRLTTRYSQERGQQFKLEFLPDAAERVLLHTWPDNLRGMQRLVHRAAGLVPSARIGTSALLSVLPELRQSDPPPAAAAAHSMRAPAARPTREALLAVYEANGRSVRATAKHFGKERRQIYRWLDALGIARVEED